MGHNMIKRISADTSISTDMREICGQNIGNSTIQSMGENMCQSIGKSMGQVVRKSTGIGKSKGKSWRWGNPPYRQLYRHIYIYIFNILIYISLSLYIYINIIYIYILQGGGSASPTTSLVLSCARALSFLAEKRNYFEKYIQR